ncbi:hypothetical protein [Rhizobium sullae]|uniref:hypothetical protein n=1 Tax=Rhizobium sullae TaxID=50338 RepID=UPI003CC80256
MAGLTTAQFAYQTGSGLFGAGLVGLVAAGAAFGLLAVLFDTLRSPDPASVGLVFAVPAAVAGYARVHGITREAMPSEIWRQLFCIVGGGFVGVSALLHLDERRGSHLACCALRRRRKPIRFWGSAARPPLAGHGRIIPSSSMPQFLQFRVVDGESSLAYRWTHAIVPGTSAGRKAARACPRRCDHP